MHFPTEELITCPHNTEHVFSRSMQEIHAALLSLGHHSLTKSVLRAILVKVRGEVAYICSGEVLGIVLHGHPELPILFLMKAEPILDINTHFIPQWRIVRPVSLPLSASHSPRITDPYQGFDCAFVINLVIKVETIYYVSLVIKFSQIRHIIFCILQNQMKTRWYKTFDSLQLRNQVIRMIVYIRYN